MILRKNHPRQAPADPDVGIDLDIGRTLEGADIDGPDPGSGRVRDKERRPTDLADARGQAVAAGGGTSELTRGAGDDLEGLGGNLHAGRECAGGDVLARQAMTGVADEGRGTASIPHGTALAAAFEGNAQQGPSPDRPHLAREFRGSADQLGERLALEVARLGQLDVQHLLARALKKTGWVGEA